MKRYLIIALLMGMTMSLWSNTVPKKKPTKDANGVTRYDAYLTQQWAKRWAKPMGGGWVSGKRNAFFKLETRIFSGSAFYSEDGEVLNAGKNNEGTFVRNRGTNERLDLAAYVLSSFYTEFGVTDWLDITVNVPFLVATYQEASLLLTDRQNASSTTTTSGETTIDGLPTTAQKRIDRRVGIGDIDIGVYYGIIRDRPFALSVGVVFGLPTGRQATSVSVGTFDTAEENDLGATGDGEFNQLIDIKAGYSFYPKPVYVSASTGFNNRTNDFSDEIRFSVESGATFFNRMFVKALLRGNYSLDNGDRKNSPFVFSLFLNNVQYTAFGVEVGIGFLENNPLVLSLGVDGAFTGQNIIAAPSTSISLSYAFTRKPKSGVPSRGAE